MASPSGQGREPPALARLRSEMDALDLRLRDLLQERARLARRIAETKRRAGLPLHDPDREAAVVDRVTRTPGTGLGPAELGAVFRFLMRVTRRSVRRRDGP